MATNNIRVVGYLPPPYHEKLREYMQSQSLIERRLAVLESAFVSSQRSRSAQRTPYQYGPPPVLPPQDITQLARRLGVSVATLESAAQKDEAEFRDWSRRRDPAQRSWSRQGELFHPHSE